jgi:peptidoglycan/xylan/chitin deacetylase (PgdA/CDA1 family)
MPIAGGRFHSRRTVRQRIPADGRRVRAGLMTLLLCAGGCPLADPCGERCGEGITVVLTFDDGPLRADVSQPEHVSDTRTLLEPLHRFLALLERRGSRAVFFVKGPGRQGAADVLKDVYAEGLLAIHRSGHVLGYHAFRHDPAIWVEPLAPPCMARAAMREDLDRLQSLLDEALATAGSTQQDLFSPIFRQPFGGAGVDQQDALRVAAQRGWTYHGFDIDSSDWIANADTDPRVLERLGDGETGQVSFVLDRLGERARRTRERAVVDVLFHVNDLTAAHLDDWMDELNKAFGSAGRGPVRFVVPDCYLRFSEAT